MKFKYFLRGLGIGMLFASIIFFIAYRQDPSVNLTDEEIIQKAKALGMVEKKDPVKELLTAGENSSESDELLSTDTIEDNSSEKNASEKITVKTEEKSVSEEEKISEKQNSKESITSEVTTEEKKQKATTGQQITTDEEVQIEQQITTMEEIPTEQQITTEEEVEKVVSFTIRGGSSSLTVCKNLQKEGLIENAAELDAYLIENRYANRIRAGTYELQPGMSFEEIAKKISSTGKRTN